MEKASLVISILILRSHPLWVKDAAKGAAALDESGDSGALEHAQYAAALERKQSILAAAAEAEASAAEAEGTATQTAAQTALTRAAAAERERNEGQMVTPSSLEEGMASASQAADEYLREVAAAEAGVFLFLDCLRVCVS